MRATMELHGDALHYPPIRAQVALGNEDLTVKVTLRPSGSNAVCRLPFGHAHFRFRAGERPRWRRAAA